MSQYISRNTTETGEVATPGTNKEVHTSHSTNRGSSVSFTPSRDMRIKVMWATEVIVGSNSYSYNVYVTHSGCTAVSGAGPRGMCKIHRTSNNVRGQALSDVGFYDCTKGITVSFGFGSCSPGASTDNNCHCVIVVEEI